MNPSLASLVRLVLTWTLAVPAHAAPSFPTAPYLKTCEGLLEAVRDDAVEPFLMNQAATPAERGQLLLDYGLVFTREYAAAVTTVLRRRLIGRLGEKAFAAEIRAITSVPGATARFADEVLGELTARAAVGATPVEIEALTARRRRFRAALDARPDRAEWVDVFSTALRSTFAATRRERRIQARNNKERQLPLIFGTSLIAGVSGMEWWLFQATPAFVHHLGVADAMIFGLFGLGGGWFGGIAIFGLNALRLHVAPDPAAPAAVTSRGRLIVPAPLDRIEEMGSPEPALAAIDPAKLDEFSVVDVIYVGHLEFRDALNATRARHKFDARDVDHHVARLIERGEALAAAGWTDARARLRVAAAINDLAQVLDRLPRPARADADQDLTKLRTAVERLGQVPLDLVSGQLNDERVLKQEALMIRHQVGLETLDALAGEVRPGAGLAGVIEPLRIELRGLLTPAPVSADDWRRTVERARALAARVEAALAGVPRPDLGPEEPIDSPEQLTQ